MKIKSRIILILVGLFLFGVSSSHTLAVETEDPVIESATSNESAQENEDAVVTEEEEVVFEETNESIDQPEEQSEESNDQESIMNDNEAEDDKSSIKPFSLPGNESVPTSFGEGARGQFVVQLKLGLSKLGIGNYPASPSDFYGTSTSINVSEFQRYYGLEMTGYADEETLAVLDANVNSSYQNGKSGNHIVELKKKLTILGIGNYPSNPSGNFGGSTEVNLRRFQRMYNLKENGIGDDVTLAKLNEVIIPRSGVRGQHVVELKKKLSKLGIGNYPANPSDFFGNSTTVNVKEFQRYYGLTVDGIVGEQTSVALERNANSPYQTGNYGSHVVELKIQLSHLGIGNYPANPSGSYGSSTDINVRRFQAYYGLKENGIADDVTLAKLDEILNSPYQSGNSGPHVVELKQKLSHLGIGNYPANPSGNFGSSTEVNVRRFQSYYGLIENGIADDVTLAKLNEIVNTPYQMGNSGAHVVELKQNLTRLGIGSYPANPSPTYGSSTDVNVRRFQVYYGLNENGIADELTLTKMQEILNSPYRNGQSGSHVVELKRNLSQLGFGNYPANPSGNYGGSTEINVRRFQSYFGLNENGIADEVTLAKIDEVLNSPYRSGQRGDHVIELKRQLSRLGIGNYPVNPSPSYGSSTATNVRRFQSRYGLYVSGIADEITLAKLAEVVSSQHIINYEYYDLTLEEALDVQMSQLQQTDKYRNTPAYIHSNYVEIIESGVISGNAVRLRTAPEFDNSNIAHTVNNGTAVVILGEVTGALHQNSTKWYEITYNNQKLYVHSSLANPNGKTARTTSRVNVRSGPGTSYHIFDTLRQGATVNIVQEGDTWHEIRIGNWRNPTREDVKFYLDPSNNDEFQHLDLTSSVGVSPSELNKVLAGKGILDGLGEAFIEGARTHSVNEIYLIAHALLETGQGESDLAQGIEVGLNRSGNHVLVTSSNRNNLTNIRTTYNMFGIGAADSDARRLGAIRAYKEGWFTPRAAVIGGAKFIGESYIHNEYNQNTLYKMRWNPANPGYPQYATDIAWATKQINRIKDLYDLLENPVLKLNIVRYK